MSDHIEYLPADTGEESDQQQLEEQQYAEEVETALVVRPSQGLELGGLHYADDATYMAAAKSKATLVRKMVVDSGCVQKIQGRDYVKVEGWEMLAQLCGARAIVTDIKSLDDGSYLAFAELRAIDGRVLQTAQMLCGDETDATWFKRPQYTKLSMAQTRAKGKVCRMEFAPLMAMGGFLTTPAEEMPSETKANASGADPKLIEAMAENGANIEVLLDALKKAPNDNSGEELERAAIAWDEISDQHKVALWKRTRGKGGVFTHAEKKLMQSTEFRMYRPSVREAIAKEQGERDEWDAAYDAAEVASHESDD